ncbi:hypothetical protein [Clostridium botulinum]|uniref:Uncharacterized protein n=1 Tax=Clostridium botulinum TaxID=1491 RepID=A0A9Q1UXE2_CLOBO|nr:hypothetical protein [Clostridium botulinum]AEB77392.1 conserved hypothetical protein [Clostridium botulinum BKT015925]KEH96379.1 hypothetical protein Y848_13960 [Clostridium botulinum C/D str. Sp77]KLU74484.1 hypothetical protein CBC3_p0190 [Clostridium botulinum V891]KOA77632.1 hypothetical protein ADU77_07500 [Clostridium botulinum]KOA85053.1 hypothetical protein ADU74_10310 [Clostridium botulinum]
MSQVKKKECEECHRVIKRETNFYQTNNKLISKDGRLPICKKCIKEKINYNDINTIYNVLRQMDLPFIYEYWQSALNSKKDTFGTYIKNINSLQQNEGMTWEHSVFKLQNKIEDNKNIIINSSNNENISFLKEKFGLGYPDEEYELFEKKYQQLKPSFQLLTTMHEECLKEYCIDKVKEGLAKAKGDFKEAKEWASMAKDVATSGKLNPNQMSKADLSGGLDTFGQLSRMVEQTPEGELMALLPLFTEQPKDKVDVNLWCFINAVRDIKGMPECEYKDIYNFYEKRRNEYESQMLDNELSKQKEVKKAKNG